MNRPGHDPAPQGALRRGERILRHGIAQMRHSPAPERGIRRTLAALGVDSPGGATAPSSVTSSYGAPTRRRWLTGLAASLTMGTLAGWWFSQPRLATKGEETPKNPDVPHAAKGYGFSPEVIRGQYGRPLRENDRTQTIRVGSVRVEVQRVRILDVPDSMGDQNRWRDTGPHVFVEGRLYPNETHGADRKLLDVWVEIHPRPEGWVPGTILRSNALSSLKMVDGDRSLWLPAPGEGVPFQYETIAPPAVLNGAPIEVRFHIREAPASALREIGFTPAGTSGREHHGSVLTKGRSLHWKLEPVNIGIRAIPNSKRPRALATILTQEELPEGWDPFSWLEARRPWRIFKGRRLKDRPLTWQHTVIREGETRLTPLRLLYVPAAAFEPYEAAVILPLDAR